MDMLVLVGNLGSNVIDHLISPITHAKNVQKVLLFCTHPGPITPNLVYYCPPKLFRSCAVISAIYEFFNFLYLSVVNRSAYLSGFLLFPHGLVSFIVAKLTKKKLIIAIIAGRPEFYTKGTIQNIDFDSTEPPWFGKLSLNMLRHTDAIVTTGSVTKNFLVKYGISEKRIFPIISPANYTRFFPINDPKLYDLISVGSLTLIKHHEVLLLAVSIIKKKYPNISVCIVGEGPRKSKLVKLAFELGIKDNINFVGFQKDVTYYYNSAKIFVHTSEREGFPNVVLEAMMCGLPCVVSNCGDITDITKDGLNSLVVQKFSDFEGFAKAIVSLLEDEELYKFISRNASKTIENISAEDVARQWEQILVSCM